MKRTGLICLVCALFLNMVPESSRVYAHSCGDLKNIALGLGLSTIRSGCYVGQQLAKKSFRVLEFGGRKAVHLGQFGVSCAANLPSQVKAVKQKITDDVDIYSAFNRSEVLTNGRRQYFAYMAPSSRIQRKLVQNVRLVPLDLLPKKISHKACRGCVFYIPEAHAWVKLQKVYVLGSYRIMYHVSLLTNKKGVRKVNWTAENPVMIPKDAFARDRGESLKPACVLRQTSQNDQSLLIQQQNQDPVDSLDGYFTCEGF